MYKCFVKKQTNHKLKNLDLTMEVSINLMNSITFYQNQGIKKEFTSSYTPQKNGVLKRKNKNLIKVVLAMLSNIKVLKVFWRDATLIEIINKIKSSRKVVTKN